MANNRAKRIFSTCQNKSCGKEISYIPSRKQKYCSSVCYQNDPEVKKRKRYALSYFFVK